MDLARKIGRLFTVPARGLTEDVIRHVRDNHVGGVIWFQSTTNVARNANEQLQAMAEEPLLISADLEAGMGMRFTDAIWWPPAMALAATGDVALAEEQARVTAEEARAVGINHVLAPVCDVNVDPLNPVINTRSFGEDPHEVARYVAATVRGLRAGGCLSTAKHFPGHGDTHVDSHRALPVLDVDLARLRNVELVPFRAAIEAGVDSVMLGHLGIPALDATPTPVRARFENTWGTESHEVTLSGTMPATLSAPALSLLRSMGFDGMAMTDAMDMGGLAAHFDPGEAAVRALLAGEDQICYSPDTDAAIAAVIRAVKSGRLPMSRIDEAYERIRRTGFSPSPPWEGRAEARPTFIARRAITLVRDTRGLLPLRARNVAIRVFAEDPMEFQDAGNVETADAIILLLGIRPRSGKGNLNVPEEAKRIAEKHAKKTIAVSLGSPYIIRELGEVSTFIAAWGVQPVLQHAAMDAIRGEFEMTGRMPVTL
ncbi:MAG TPA: glycoside hydrolase family 3 N-terminal domain-containing protein [Thermoanaerobaculia bacterium]|nr:glycoside hydrolase family 3 N-terminal domain-containing protein [Thermoanaerobaculia bacterium]